MDGEPTVVIAEDEPELQKLLVYTLESVGYAVEAFGAGDDCWERLDVGTPPDLVILDYMMPRMDGVDVLGRIRADERLATIPVIFISGRDRESDVIAEFEADVDDYIMKPFSPRDLRTRVERLL